MRRRRTRDAKKPTVWVAQDDGYVREIFGNRESAMRWLFRQHEAAIADAARTAEFWRKEYVERADAEKDPAMRAYYQEALREPTERVGAIDDRGTCVDFYKRGDMERTSITEMDVVIFEPDVPESAPVTGEGDS